MTRWIAAVLVMCVGIGTPGPALAEAWYNMNFMVRNATTGAAIPGALVQIDTDFGNGTTRNTDGGGFANFGVVSAYQIRYVVSAAGYETADGGPIGLRADSTVDVWLTPNRTPPPVLPPVGEMLHYSTA